jgi:hypothetical protein
MICSAINPALAREMFKSPESTTTVDDNSFMDEIKKLDPNFNTEQYFDISKGLKNAD